MSSKHSTDSGRTTSFSRNAGLEVLLKDINSSLWLSEEKILRNYQSPEFPVVLIVGPMRCGTTLFMQWLANTGMVAYPTNLLSRFYQAPILGAKIQLLLTDRRYSYRDELAEIAQKVGYGSENGKTRGALAPNEFWYFWRRFLADPSRDVWTDDELSTSMDTQTMKAEFAGIMDVFGKPFLLKCMLFNYNIPFLNSVLDKVVFVRMVRDPLSNVESVLEARERQHGNMEQWYSFRIPEYEELKDLGPCEQVAGQVFYINKAIEKGLERVDDSRKLTVEYEEFCSNPKEVFCELSGKLAQNGYTVTEKYELEDRFDLSRKRSDNPGVLTAYNRFADSD